jgi:competence protein ComGC
LKQKNKKTIKRETGSTLVEALIATAILSFVVVSILGAVAQQQMTTRNSSDKNIAIFLAETRMEELLKLPANQLQEETFVDYAVPKTVIDETSAYSYNLVFIPEDENPPVEKRQFRRTTDIQLDDLGEMADISVLVEYGLTEEHTFSTDPTAMRKRHNTVLLTARRTTQ